MNTAPLRGLVFSALGALESGAACSHAHTMRPEPRADSRKPMRLTACTPLWLAMAEISHFAANVLPLREARRVVEEHASRVRPLASEPVDLLHCRDRILAENIAADRDLPPFTRATRDGYAVRATVLDKLPPRLEVAGEIRAGAPPETFSCPLQPGEAAEI